VIADRTPVHAALRRRLVLEGSDVMVAESGGEGIRHAQSAAPDAIVLHDAAGDISGLEICRLLRRSGNQTPILMLCREAETAERIACLNAGADDCMLEPCDGDELHARLRALVRRNGNGAWVRCCASRSSSWTWRGALLTSASAR
jgi:two-component system response regulator MprA